MPQHIETATGLASACKVEAGVCSLDDVQDAATGGAPHAILGDVVHAADHANSLGARTQR